MYLTKRYYVNPRLTKLIVLILIGFVLSSCAIFHDTRGLSVGDKDHEIFLNIVQNSTKVSLSKTDLESIRLMLDRPNFSFVEKTNSKIHFEIIHETNSSNAAWKSISLITLGVIPYWESMTSVLNVYKGDSKKIDKSYSLNSTSVISLFIFPVQIYKSAKSKNNLNSVRAELIKIALADL